MKLAKLIALATLLFPLAVAQGQYVHTQGQQIVDGSGKALRLHGINLGDWLVTEGYMFHLAGGPESEREIEEFVN